MRKYLIGGISLAALFLTFSFSASQAAQIQITNPLQYDTFTDLLNAIIDLLWYFSLAVVPLIIIVAGYFFIASEGDPTKVSQAKKMILYALIGFVIISLAKGVIALLQEIIKVKP
jgi:hypothetical protein